MKKVSCFLLSFLLMLSPFLSITASAKTTDERIYEQVSRMEKMSYNEVKIRTQPADHFHGDDALCQSMEKR